MTAFDRLARLGAHPLGLRSRWLPLDGARLHLLDAPGAGPRPPVLLLHGLGSVATDALPLLLRLRRSFRRVLALDLPGHGGSELPEGAEPRAAVESALARVIDHLGLDAPLMLVGNSLGGLFAARLALARPRAVAGLVLISPAGAPMREEELAALLHPFAEAGPAHARDFLQQALDCHPLLPHLLEPALRARLARPPLRALLARIRAEHLLRAEELAALPCPTLLLWGAQERVLPEAHLEFFRRHMPPGALVERPPGWSHAPLQARPAEVAARLRAFAEAAAP